jgi:class 3 adenylate cyclase
MSGTPQTRYAMVGRDHVAYQTIGQGPPDLVFAPHWNTNVEALWEFPPLAHFVRRLTDFGRVILFDKRGTGLSDALSGADQPFLEQFADDLRAVLDAIDLEKATLIASDASAMVAIVFAASYPERVSELILVNAFAGFARLDDPSDERSASAIEEHERDIQDIWMNSDFGRISPTLVADQRAAEQASRFFRLSASPNAASDARRRILHLDVRDVLRTVQVPTLVIHRSSNRYFGPDHSRYLARHIRQARLVLMPGAEHLMYMGDAEAILNEIEVFVTGERRRAVSERVLTTILFVDIVDSTSRAAEVGDQRWRDLLDTYDSEVGRDLELFRGRHVKKTGDGTLAMFDGPGRAIRCALSIRDALHIEGLELRSGLHTGEVEFREDDLLGIAVHIAERVQGMAQPGEVLVSRTVVDLVTGSGIEFEDRGEHELKGLPGAWRLFSVAD